MKILLFILLGIFIGFLIIVIAIRLLLKKFVGKISDVMKQIASEMPPPFRLKLVLEEDPKWLKEPEVKRRLDALKSAGFQMVGAYSMEGAFDSFTVGLVHPEHNVIGAVHWLKSVPCVDLVTYYDDGTSLTHSDNVRGSELPRRPQSTVVREDGASADALFNRHLAERRADSITPITIEEFSSHFEKAYDEGMTWVAERGGYTLAEIEAECRKTNPDAPAQAIEDTHQKFAQNALVNWLSMQSDRPEPWDEKESDVYAIHDDLTMRQITNILNETEEEEDSFREAEVAKAGATPREAFAAVNEKLGGRFIKVAEKTTPRAADFYVRVPEPEEPEEEETN